MVAANPFDYADAVATAIELIADFGQTGAIRRTVNSGDPWNPTQTDTDYTVTLVVIDYENKDVDGTLIRQTDRHVLVSPDGLTVEPTTADSVVVDGATLAIINVKPLNPAGTLVMYDLQCRG